MTWVAANNVVTSLLKEHDFFIVYFIFFLPLNYVTFQSGRKNIIKKNLDYTFAHKNLKKPPQKVAYLWQPRLPKTAQNFISVLKIILSNHLW